ncbi:BMP family lipoprotein [Phyllobacterium chamaecytisi]|uniref:BMP family lipoprotein n=1 Tax=Phyllobacterium chamaecytisi TaxID=2876082 RepID=UPI001CD01216|nr:BMP family ABC transporter substrate-binding protein [Phyllobacterium sp. KW56]MBZ9603294.1 BMP family ABC transporter substrate-binding protein [Phyllobacterium sp. KW56]
MTGLGDANADSPKVGIFVADSFGDRAFLDIALGGKELVEKQYGATVQTYEGRQQADKFFRQLSDAGRANDFVFVLGFEAIDAMMQAAEANERAHYIFIDAALDSPEVSSVGYRDSEGCYLVGALAARLTVSGLPLANPQKVIGFVGGVDSPVIRDCEAGYKQGAAVIDAETVVKSAWVGSWTDPAKGKIVNQSLNQDGSDINYQYAGLSGEGGFDNVRGGSAGYALGAGFDQSSLAPGFVPGSMLKRVDQTILRVTSGIIDGKLQKGFTETEGVAEGSLTMVYNDKLVSADIREQVETLAKRIASGEIKVTSAR